MTGDRHAGASALAALADRAMFAAAFLRSPLATASVWPSSSALAGAVVAAAADGVGTHGGLGALDAGDGTHAPVVVELGAGSGAFTEVLARRLDGRGRHLAVEINPVLARRLAERLPGVEVAPADVAGLPALLAEHHIGAADVVVCGLGWSATRPGREDSLVPVAARALADDGVFVQLAYTGTRWAAPARALVRDMHASFATVTTSTVVWRNLPPAVVHRARGPRR